MVAPFLQLAARDDVLVFATARSPEKVSGLQELKAKHGDKLHLVKLDVSDEKSIQVSGRCCDAWGLSACQESHQLIAPSACRERHQLQLALLACILGYIVTLQIWQTLS